MVVWLGVCVCMCVYGCVCGRGSGCVGVGGGGGMVVWMIVGVWRSLWGMMRLGGVVISHCEGMYM